MPRKEPVKTEGRKVGPRSGFLKVTLSLRPEQLTALVGAARRRADERGAIRADASEVAREAIDAWLKRLK